MYGGTWSVGGRTAVPGAGASAGRDFTTRAAAINSRWCGVGAISDLSGPGRAKLDEHLGFKASPGP